jgi:outer membrane receptor for ferrienterochelin and colicins
MFRNNLTNMIEYTPIVKKNNGMYVYSYRNFNEVYTQGSELQISHNPLDFLEVSIGFQYLESADIKVLDRIKKGEIGYLDKNQEYIKITSSDYGGLFNRSKYTANFIIKYKSEEFGFTSAIRGTYRSRYGFTDLNDNQVLDADNEYAPGYSIINWTLNKNLLDNLVLQFGIDNLLDYKDTKFVLTNPGRTFFLSLSFNLINE